MSSKILIIGAGGQIGSELTSVLRETYGRDNVITSDINNKNQQMVNSGPFEVLDAKSFDDIKACIEKHQVDTVYLMAALLSATGEKFPEKAWNLNTESLFHVLNLAKEGIIKKIFWPSSIAIFGPTTPKDQTPQHTICEPTTVYGITKQVGERWCQYYHDKFGVDVRSLRYPGIISYKTLPGGGTTDYAVDIFHKAITDGHYDCFLSENTKLPMMFMDDAIRATIEIMDAEADSISIRSSYNLSALSFSPEELYNAIKTHKPNFTITYQPDFRQAIADSWPSSIDDSMAKEDWNWNPKYDLEAMTKVMLDELHISYNSLEKELS